jgi:sphingolipid delta-4 desaturase
MGKGGQTPTPTTTVNGSTHQLHPNSPSSSSDFTWSTKDEPHASRRRQILAKYPEIKQLYGHDESLKYKTALVVLTQLSLAYYSRNSIGSVYFWILAYVVGGTANHAMFMAMHELSHNLGFKKMHHNRWFSMFANIPVAVPVAISFKRYHMDHHVRAP